MSTLTFVELLLALVLVVYAAIAAIAWLRARGTRIVICPETQKPAAVEVDAAHAAVSALWEDSGVRLHRCSRWPERAGCDQACATQIAIAPHDTRVTAVLTKWYDGKSCAICQRAISPPNANAPQPGLYNVASSETLSWQEIPAQNLPAVLETHLAVCANCQVAESFRRQFPDLVIDRRADPRRNLSVH
jgi:hypothetical protein